MGYKKPSDLRRKYIKARRELVSLIRASVREEGTTPELEDRISKKSKELENAAKEYKMNKGKLDLAFDVVINDRTVGKVELMLNEDEVGISIEEYKAMDENQKENFAIELMHTAFESQVGCILTKAHLIV